MPGKKPQEWLDQAEYDLEPAETLLETIFVLNRVSVPTRYPESLKKLLADYDRKKTTDLVRNSQEVLRWLKTQL